MFDQHRRTTQHKLGKPIDISDCGLVIVTCDKQIANHVVQSVISGQFSGHTANLNEPMASGPNT